MTLKELQAKMTEIINANVTFFTSWYCHRVTCDIEDIARTTSKYEKKKTNRWVWAVAKSATKVFNAERADCETLLTEFLQENVEEIKGVYDIVRTGNQYTLTRREFASEQVAA